MQATPNLDFGAVEPKKDSLYRFVGMLTKVYRNLVAVINGRVGFGDGTLHDNVDGVWANVVAPVAPNTDFIITHNLGRIPVGYWIMQKDRAADVYTGSVAATISQLTLRATVASAVLRLFIICLVLSLFGIRAEAQTTSLTLQVTDAGGQTWNNGTWTATLQSPPGASNFGPPFNQIGTGTSVPNQSQSGTLSATGSATATFWQNASITPGQSQWKFSVCPQGTGVCFSQFVTITATTTLTLTPPAILVNCNPGVTAYTDVEVNCVIGGQYYNLTSQVNKVCQAATGSVCTTWGASSASSGIPFVTSGLIADCLLTEISGTTVNCGVAGNANFSSGNPGPPIFPNVVGFPLSTGATVLGYDSFLSSPITTEGKWTIQQGTFTVSGGSLTAASGGGDGVANVIFTSQPISRNQWAQVTISALPVNSGGTGPMVYASPTAETSYVCYRANSAPNVYIKRASVGVLTNLITGNVGSPAVGDVILLTAKMGSDNTTTTLNCYINGSLALTTTDQTQAQSLGQPGVSLVFGVGLTGSTNNFQAGILSPSTAAGLLFEGHQSVSLPASVNSAQTLEVYACYQRSSNSNLYNGLVVGNGNGGASQADGVILNGQAIGVTGESPVAQIQMPRIGVLSNSSITVTEPHVVLNGCGLATVSFGNAATPVLDHVYLNGQEGIYIPTAQGSTGLQVVGNYFLGGTPSGSGFSSNTFFTGTIYRFRAFNRILTSQEVAQDSAAMNEYMLGRGVTTFSGDLLSPAKDNCVVDGDSMSNGSGSSIVASQVWTNAAVLFTPINGSPYFTHANGPCWLTAVNGAMMAQVAPLGGIFDDPLFSINGARNVNMIWAATNDSLLGGTQAGTLQAMAQFAIARRQRGWKVIAVNMVSRGISGSCVAEDAWKDIFNPLWRQSVSVWADGWVDLASDPAFADGGCTGNVLQADNLHPSGHGSLNHLAPFFQREINTIYGNHDFSTANTYTATSTAATTITAATESTNTVTLTMGSNPWVAGQCVVVVGVTPAGYNSPANQCWMVLTANATTLTYFNPTAGLGAGSVFGTVQSAQELDQDQYAVLGGSAVSPNHILQTCQARTGHSIYRQVTNTNAGAWTITSLFGETINGGATFTAPVASATNRPIVRLTSILTSNTAGGCSWQASLQ